MNLSAALTTSARIYLALGDKAQAESRAAAALRISEGIARSTSQSADAGDALLAMAYVQLAQGRRSAARESLGQAIEALRNGVGPDHPATREALALQTSL